MLRHGTTWWIPMLGLAAAPLGCSAADATGADGGPDVGTSPPDAGTTADANGDATTGADTSTGDTGTSDTGASDTGADSGGTAFRVSGRITYDWVSANDDVTEGGVKLDYAGKAARPVRRAFVYAMEAGAILVTTMTNDAGAFALDVPAGHTVTLRVAAKSVVTANVPDGIAPDRCAGASWDVKLVDNTQTDAAYVLDAPTAYSAANTSVALNASLAFSGTAYTSRASAPFAILDTIITEIELVCQGRANVSLPSLNVNWSVNNVGTSGDVTLGQIGTSHYTRDRTTGQSKLYILGKENVDTDEYDDHVIAHEFGHYLEDRAFRSDSVGGSHSAGESLDPRVAFGEGWGNALSGMTFNDPIYVDTSGAQQAGGFSIRVNAAPTGDDRGVYNESSMQYMLWSLFDNRAPGNGTFERIYDVFENFQKTTPGLTTGVTFAAYYNQVYGGTAEQLQTVWGTTLATPYDALCVGACVGTNDVADPFDTDNDIGLAYAATRKYPETTGGTFSAEFWRLLRPLADGTNAATAHDLTNFGGYPSSGNKLGSQRWYRYTSTVAAPVTISVANLGASNCTTDVLDMDVRLSGASVGFDQSTTGATAGCPQVQFTTAVGLTYTIVVNGFATELPSFDIMVAR